MKRIGIKYCGGCQAFYDRGEWVRTLLDDLRKQIGEVQSVSPDTDIADMLLIVCGCPTLCIAQCPDETAGVGRPNGTLPCHVIGPDGLFDHQTIPRPELVARLVRELRGEPL